MQPDQVQNDNPLDFIPPAATIRSRLITIAEEARKLRILLRTAEQSRR